MKLFSYTTKVVFSFVVLLSVTALAHAQATRTWVAHAPTGDDANPCSRSAPCATFAGAVSKTREGGEIDAIDPGSFGAVTINKAITIDGGTGAGWAGILVTSEANGIVVNVTTGTDADNAVVILRNLTLNGAKQGPGTGGNVGIQVIKVEELHLEHINIQNFRQHGIDVNGADTISVFMQHVSLSRDSTAIKTNAAAGFFAVAHMDDVSMQGNQNGLNAVANSVIVIRNSNFGANQGTLGAIKASSGCFVSLENNMFSGNAIAVNVDTGGVVNISNNSFYGNVTALTGGGTIATATNSNKFAGNTSDGATNATITLK